MHYAAICAVENKMEIILKTLNKKADVMIKDNGYSYEVEQVRFLNFSQYSPK